MSLLSTKPVYTQADLLKAAMFGAAIVLILGAAVYITTHQPCYGCVKAYPPTNGVDTGQVTYQNLTNQTQTAQQFKAQCLLASGNLIDPNICLFRSGDVAVGRILNGSHNNLNSILGCHNIHYGNSNVMACTSIANTTNATLPSGIIGYEILKFPKTNSNLTAQDNQWPNWTCDKSCIRAPIQPVQLNQTGVFALTCQQLQNAINYLWNTTGGMTSVDPRLAFYLTLYQIKKC